MFECCICHQHARRTLLGVLRHIKEVHPYFRTAVVCGLSGCVATSSSFQALRTHLYRNHRDKLDVRDSDVTEDVTAESETMLADQELPQEPNDPSPLLPAPSSTLLGAEFIMKIRDGKGLTQVATDGILQDTKIVLQSTLDSVKEALLNKLRDLPVTMTEYQVSDLASVFSEAVEDPFRGLESVYKQEKFIHEHFNYVVSGISKLHLASK